MTHYHHDTDTDIETIVILLIFASRETAFIYLYFNTHTSCQRQEAVVSVVLEAQWAMSDLHTWVRFFSKPQSDGLFQLIRVFQCLVKQQTLGFTFCCSFAQNCSEHSTSLFQTMLSKNVCAAS